MRRFRLMLRLLPLVILAALVGLFGVLPFVFANATAERLVHPARLPVTNTPSDVGFTVWETVRLDAPDGTQLVGWFIPPPPGALDGTPSDGAALLYLHGLGSNRQALLLQAAFLYRQGFGALLLDQRAHGDSGGSVSTLGHLELGDASIMLDYLLARPEVNPKKVGIVGESMGAVVGLLLASHRPDDVRAVVAQSPYASVEGVMQETAEREAGLLALTFVPFTRMIVQNQTGSDLSAIVPLQQVYWIAPRAVLLLHGDGDRLVDPSNSQRLYDAARDPRELVFFASGGHGGLLEADPALWGRRVTGFLRRYLRDLPAETETS